MAGLLFGGTPPFIRSRSFNGCYSISLSLLSGQPGPFLDLCLFALGARGTLDRFKLFSLDPLAFLLGAYPLCGRGFVGNPALALLGLAPGLFLAFAGEALSSAARSLESSAASASRFSAAASKRSVRSISAASVCCARSANSCQSLAPIS